ncbi:MAG: cytochrome c oxidase subunit II, partial [Flavobacteriales bacterium]|nr:cytochrome c oxidase subunit II [Flavobacteriales bacterium]
IYTFSDDLLPRSASVHGESIDNLLNFNFIIVNLVFVLVNVVLFWFAYKYVRKPGGKATFFAHSTKLELIWTVVPSIFLAIIIIYGLRVWNSVMTKEASENAIIVELYARQFDWAARYAGEDGELGRANVQFIESGTNDVGIDISDSRSADDKVVRNEFHLPVNRPVKFLIRSQDVIHSAYMPHFRAQMNAVPGMVTSFEFTPKYTTAEMREFPEVIEKYGAINETREELGKEPTEFDFILLCNKICGSSHYNMQMKIVVESEEDFNAWLGEQKTTAQVVGTESETGLAENKLND